MTAETAGTVVPQEGRAERLRRIQAQAHQATGRVWSVDDVNTLTREVVKGA